MNVSAKSKFSEVPKGDNSLIPHSPSLLYVDSQPLLHNGLGLFASELLPVHEQVESGFTLPRPVKEDMTFLEYTAWWKTQHQRTADCPESSLLYLKDWEFVSEQPNIGAYEWPIYFQNDWLNGAMGSAYKFIYVGPKGTST